MSLHSIHEITWADEDGVHPILCVGRNFNRHKAEIGSIVRPEPFNETLVSSADSYLIPDAARSSLALLQRHYRPFDMRRAIVVTATTVGNSRALKVDGKAEKLAPYSTVDAYMNRLAQAANRRGYTAASTRTKCTIKYSDKKPDLELAPWVDVWIWPKELGSRVIFEAPAGKN